jgi:hypothetical protein
MEEYFSKEPDGPFERTNMIGARRMNSRIAMTTIPNSGVLRNSCCSFAFQEDKQRVRHYDEGKRT